MSIGEIDESSWTDIVGVDWSPADRREPATYGFSIDSSFENGCIAGDARIDNQEELRSSLGVARGSLRELLLGAYFAWGEAFVERLSGDFAFAIWDARSRRLFAARDPFAVRPLFYRTSAGALRLSSAVPALLRANDGANALEDETIVGYLLRTYESTGATYFRDVHELPAGHYLVADGNRLEVREYRRPWMEPRSLAKIGPEDCSRQFRDLFIGAVKERLTSSNPVMLHVSGGLDSSSIAGAADLLVRRGDLPAPAVRGVASVHPGLACDERPFIEAVARRSSFPIDLWDGTVSEGEDPDLFDPSVARPGIRAMFRNGTIGDIKIARGQGSTVILSGTGGDELGIVFGYVLDLIANRRVAQALHELLFFPGATMWGRARRTNGLVHQAARSLLPRFRRSRRVNVPRWLAPRLRGMAMAVHDAKVPSANLPSHIAGNVWRRMNSPRLAMAIGERQAHAAEYGVSMRFPFLDRELLSFVLSLPHTCWPKPGPYARLHRGFLSDLLPAEVAGRLGKAEFSSALAHRMRNARPRIETMLEARSWFSEPYVDPVEARRFCRGVLSRGNANTPTEWLSMWSILTLEAWLQKTFGYSNRRSEVS